MIKKNFLAIFIFIVLLFFVVFVSGGCGGGSGGSSSESNKNNPQDNIQYEEGEIQNILDSAVAAVNLGYQGGNNSRYVTEDLELPESSKGIKLSWESSNSGVISNNGKVSRPTGSNIDVTLTVFAESMDFTASRDFDVSVIKKRARTIEQAKLEIEPVDIADIKDINESDDFFQVKYNESESEDVISFIDGQFSDITVENADDAQDALWSVHESIGIDDPYEELELINIAQDVPLEEDFSSNDVESSAAITTGSSYSFQQVFNINGNKIPVYGRTVTVSTNKRGQTVYLSSSSALTFRIKRMIATTGQSSIMDRLSAGMYALETYPEGFMADTSRVNLVIYTIGKDSSNDYEKNPVMAYTVRVLGSDENGNVDDTVIINAVTGKTIVSYPNNIEIDARGTDELGNTVTFPVSKISANEVTMNDFDINEDLPYAYIYVYSGDFRTPINRPANDLWNDPQDPVRISAYTNMRKNIRWWKDVFDRNGLDNKYHFVSLATKYAASNNAFWNNNEIICVQAQRNFETGIYDRSFAICLDVLTHESCHAVLDYITKNLIGSTNCSGAINEGYADVFGCLIDRDWKIGWVKDNDNDDETGITPYKIKTKCIRDARKDVTVASLTGELISTYSYGDYNNDYIRYLKNVVTMNDLYNIYNRYYDRAVSKLNDCNGVHFYCRLISHAAYLMHEDGAAKIGRASKGLNWDELGKVWYASMNKNLNVIATFHTVRENVINAARHYGLSNAKVFTIKKAFDAVEITEPQGRFTGRITDYETGNPINGGAMISISSKVTENEIIKAYTDTDGYFTISADPGNYKITIEAVNGNYVPLNLPARSISEKEEIDLSTGLNKDEKGSLIITAKDENGNTLTGVQFSLTNASGLQVVRGFTDINGKCTFNNVPVGNYTLLAVKSGYQNQVFDAVILSNTTNSMTATLEPNTGSLVVEVRDMRGNRLTGVQIALTNNFGQNIMNKFTDINGKCTFNHIPSGDYSRSYNILVYKKGYLEQNDTVTIRKNLTQQEKFTLAKTH